MVLSRQFRVPEQGFVVGFLNRYSFVQSHLCALLLFVLAIDYEGVIAIQYL